MLDRFSPLTEVLMVRLGMQGGRLNLLARTKDNVRGVPILQQELNPGAASDQIQEDAPRADLEGEKVIDQDGVTSCLHTEILSGILPVT